MSEQSNIIISMRITVFLYYSYFWLAKVDGRFFVFTVGRC